MKLKETKQRKDIIKEIKDEIDDIENILMPENKVLNDDEYRILTIKAKAIIRILIDYIIT